MAGAGRADAEAVRRPLLGESISAVAAASPWIAESVALRRSILTQRRPATTLARYHTATTPAESPAALPPGPSSFFLTTFNTVNLLVGVGLLAYPYALRMGGWAGLLVLLLIAGMTRYTASILGSIIQTHPAMTTFADMGQAAFGQAGSTLIAVAFFFELLLGAGSAFSIVGADSIAALFPSISVHDAILIFVAIMWTTTLLPDLSFLAWVSLLGMLSSVVIVVAVVVNGAENDGQPGGISPPAPTDFAHWQRLPYTFGLFMVGFAGHAVFPSIYHSMRDRSQFERVLNISYVIVFAIYGGMAAIGYLEYGNETKPEITLSLQRGFFTQLSLWLIIVNVFSKFGLTMDPVARVVDTAISWVLLQQRAASATVADAAAPSASGTPPPVGHSVAGDGVSTVAVADAASAPRETSTQRLLRAASRHKMPRRENLHLGPLPGGLTPPRQLRRGGSLLRDSSSSSPGLTGSSTGTDDDDDDDDADDDDSDSESGLHRPCCSRPWLRAWGWHVFLRTALTGVALVIALYLPYFDFILSLTGSVVSFFVSIIFPPAAYNVLCGASLPVWQQRANWAVSLLGLVMAVLGTITTITGSL